MKKIFWPVAAMAAFLAPLGGAALAQDASETIVVTAQKREQNLQEVPASVSVVQGSAISPAVSSIDQLLSAIPTLNFKRGGTPLDSSLFLRGVGTINFSIAAEPSVATVVDGVVLARAGEAFGDLYDIERIEVLRGPQGTLFGKNASAGVINIVTRRPAPVHGGSLEVTAFDDEEYKAKFGLDLPLGEDVRTRLTGFYGVYDGNITNLFNGETINGYEHAGLRAVTEIDVSDTLTFTFSADYRHTSDDGTGEIIGTAPTATGATRAALLTLLSGVNLGGDETREVRHNLTSASNEEGWGFSGQADLDLGGGYTLTSISGFRDWTIFGIREGDWLDQRAAYVGNTFAQLHDFGPQTNSTFTQEVRITSPAGERLEYVAGLFYYKAEAERTFRRDTVVCTATTLPVNATGLAPCATGSSTYAAGWSQATFGSEFENFAAFGDASFDITDQLTILGGVRFAWDDLTAYHDRIPSAIALPGIRTDGTGFVDSTTSDSITGRAGLQYAFTDDIISYATYSRGYKGPAYNVFFNQTAQQRNVIDGEDVDAYEAGLKTTTFGGRAVVNLSAFYANYDNFQANSFDTLNGVVITRLTNAGEISTSGFELEWRIRPIDDLTFSGGVAYADAQIERFRAPDGTISDARQGERIALAPEWKYTVAADYSLRPDNLPFGVDFNVQYAFTDEQYSDIGINPLLLIDSYGLLDARISFSDPDDRYRLSLIGRNLTDESFASLITPGGPGGALRFQIPREADRYFGVSLSTRFGG